VGEAMIELSKQISPADNNRLPTPVEPTRETLTINGDDRQHSDQAQAAKRIAAHQKVVDLGRKLTKEEAQEWAGFANDFLSSVNIGLRFKVLDNTNNWYMQLVNEESGEVVREIPSKEILQMAARLKEMMDNAMARKEPIGVLLDSKL